MASAPNRRIFVGCAGWTMSRAELERFPGPGTHLERYAHRLPCVEINTTFYHLPQRKTYERWAASAPRDFVFSVKMPRAITHFARLRVRKEQLRDFLKDLKALGKKLGPILVQLPPSLKYDAARARRFFRQLRDLYAGAVVCEPRHPSWFTPEVNALLRKFRVARVAADPACVPQAGEPAGWTRVAYYRLHGSPEMYYSSYPPEFLEILSEGLRKKAVRGPGWCIFDNTGSGAATQNALQLWERVSRSRA